MPRTDWGQPWREYHVLSDSCRYIWCRLHYWPHYGDHLKYPMETRVRDAEGVWRSVWVYCGPGAYLPRKPRSLDISDRWYPR